MATESADFASLQKTSKKQNPTPSLTNFQKAYNKFIGSNRIVIENAIAGLKRYAIVAAKFRNKSLDFADEMIDLAAGLWNFKLARKMKAK